MATSGKDIIYLEAKHEARKLLPDNIYQALFPNYQKPIILRHHKGELTNSRASKKSISYWLSCDLDFDGNDGMAKELLGDYLKSINYEDRSFLVTEYYYRNSLKQPLFDLYSKKTHWRNILALGQYLGLRIQLGLLFDALRDRGYISKDKEDRKVHKKGKDYISIGTSRTGTEFYCFNIRTLTKLLKEVGQYEELKEVNGKKLHEGLMNISEFLLQFLGYDVSGKEARNDRLIRGIYQIFKNWDIFDKNKEEKVFSDWAISEGFGIQTGGKKNKVLHYSPVLIEYLRDEAWDEDDLFYLLDTVMSETSKADTKTKWAKEIVSRFQEGRKAQKVKEHFMEKGWM